MSFKLASRSRYSSLSTIARSEASHTPVGNGVGGSDASPQRGWQQAVASHLSNLTPEQTRDFKAPTSLEECLAVLNHAASRTGRVSKLLKFFEPVIQPLKRFESALDVTVQVNAGIASPIWGPLKVAITVSVF